MCNSDVHESRCKSTVPKSIKLQLNPDWARTSQIELIYKFYYRKFCSSHGNRLSSHLKWWWSSNAVYNVGHFSLQKSNYGKWDQGPDETNPPVPFDATTSTGQGEPAEEIPRQEQDVIGVPIHLSFVLVLDTSATATRLSFISSLGC
jgi:hypothetical protein